MGLSAPNTVRGKNVVNGSRFVRAAHGDGVASAAHAEGAVRAEHDDGADRASNGIGVCAQTVMGLSASHTAMDSAPHTVMGFEFLQNADKAVA